MSQNLDLGNEELLADDEDNRMFQHKMKFEDFIDFMLEDSSSSKDILQVVKRVRDSKKLRESISKSRSV